MPAINPYLNFNGNAEEAFNFYKSVFGGEFQMVMRMKDAPVEHRMHASKPEDLEQFMHIALPIVNGNILMASDVPESFQKIIFGTNFSISITAYSDKETDRIFNGISAGGKVTMPLSKTFWGSYFGMCTDKFGIHWMVSHDSNRQ
jgi:PhnB protein